MAEKILCQGQCGKKIGETKTGKCRECRQVKCGFRGCNQTWAPQTRKHETGYCVAHHDALRPGQRTGREYNPFME